MLLKNRHKFSLLWLLCHGFKESFFSFFLSLWYLHAVSLMLIVILWQMKINRPDNSDEYAYSMPHP